VKNSQQISTTIDQLQSDGNSARHAPFEGQSSPNLVKFNFVLSLLTFNERKETFVLSKALSFCLQLVSLEDIRAEAAMSS